MGERTYDATARLASGAEALRRAEAPAGGLPGLLVLTDPVRTPDPLALARALPSGCGVILRTFGRPEIEAQAFALTEALRARDIALLISADPGLARRAGAQGVHWPQWSLARAHRPWPGALVTASVHDPAALRRAQTIADAVLVSTVFASHSPSAGRPMGPFRLAAWARRSRAPVYALGGITARTVRRLTGLGVGGAGAVGAAAHAVETVQARAAHDLQRDGPTR